MNATSLYVSTCRLVLQADVEDPNSWTDLYRLVPYLRQSLSCSVCSNLLIEPHTPKETNCQHHVCRMCRGGRKKLKPTCMWCKDYTRYDENLQLRILLQCYKKLCEYVISTAIYITLIEQATTASAKDESNGTTSLIDLIQEGAGFKDNYKSTAGLTKSEYSILPCVYTNSSTQTLQSTPTVTGDLNKQILPSNVRTVSNGSALYSVLYAGRNKITIKRKHSENDSQQKNLLAETSQANTSFKKPNQRINNRNFPKRKGCRCGNATATPGKLTCCGQRCPCYVENKACIDCRCRGCRNPHRPNGFKVRPHIPQLHDIQLHTTILTNDSITIESIEPPSINFDNSGDMQVMDLYGSDLSIANNLPNTILMTEDSLQHTSDGESSEIEVDV
ncbi:male-specific lethal 2 [Carabus blaptoides fortunei]